MAQPAKALSYPTAKTQETLVRELDLARKVTVFDALPDASRWFVVDKFEGKYSVVLNGQRHPADFDDIPQLTAQMSPDGSRVVWFGQRFALTQDKYDSTVTVVFQDFDSLAALVSDANTLRFSASGKHWGALFPRANNFQKSPRDFVLIDGKVVAQDKGYPKLFAFSPDEKHWAFRTSEGNDERLIDQDGERLLYTRPVAAHPGVLRKDSIIWYYSPDNHLKRLLLEAKDYDPGFRGLATLHKSDYSPMASDTVRSYITFKNKTHGLYRWIQNVLIDSAANHIVYLACNPAQGSTRDESVAVVVYDGKVVTEPFRSAGRLFLSASGKHFAHQGGTPAVFNVDGKPVGEIEQAIDCVWSPDESIFAVVSLNPRGTLRVIAGGKQSEVYERVGRIAFSNDKRSIHYAAIRNGKLIRVRQDL